MSIPDHEIEEPTYYGCQHIEGIKEDNIYKGEFYCDECYTLINEELDRQVCRDRTYEQIDWRVW